MLRRFYLRSFRMEKSSSILINIFKGSVKTSSKNIPFFLVRKHPCFDREHGLSRLLIFHRNNSTDHFCLFCQICLYIQNKELFGIYSRKHIYSLLKQIKIKKLEQRCQKLFFLMWKLGNFNMFFNCLL